MFINLTVYFILLWMFSFCMSYKLLVVFPVPGKSHAHLGNVFVSHLLDAGHEVTYIAPIPMESDNPRFRQINVESVRKIFGADKFIDVEKLLSRESDMKDMSVVFTCMFNLANLILNHENVQNLIHDSNEQFDAVIAEWMYSDLYSGLSAVYNCPLIYFLPVCPHNMALSLIDNDLNPAYTADHIKSDTVPPFTFLTRIQELMNFVNWKMHRWWVNDRNCQTFDKAFKQAVSKRGRVLPSLHELKYNASLMFGNSHILTGNGMPLPRNFIEIGGYHINYTNDTLPENLQNIMDRAENGVIFFSMGSMLKSAKFPEKIKTELIQMFAQLNQTVIWKFEDTLTEKPKNLHLIDWAPQRAILAHPNCILFITHGGLLSTTEAFHFKVPFIGIPMFADQFINVNRAVTKGVALKVDFNYDAPINLKIAIDEVLGNPMYHERINELSYVYHDRRAAPGEEISRWVHHVIKTKGAPHLRSPALLVPWYQKMYLDFILLIFIIFLSIIIILTAVIKGYMYTKNNYISLSKKYS
ncbi:UDP-glucosyltransferase 2-like [Battus philenor]|uniref:UDP-glucosyltransferase 2-like n=1 Tax=Battus philenor TaxID=42288 RepID=UPI0035D10786